MGLPVLTDSLQSYLTEINRYPVLSDKEELAVAKRYYKHKALEDAHALVTANLRYVVKIALEYRNYGCKLADLIQEGNIGLMVAVKKFNPLKGFRLITYATWWIRSFIQDFILKTRGLVKRNTKALKKKLFYKNGGLETAPAEGAIDVHEGIDSFDLSLDATIDGKRTHLEMLGDSAPGHEEAVSFKESEKIVKNEVELALSKLNEKERIVIEKRVLSDEPESLQGIGERLGLTRERVRQIESSALKKLEKTLMPIKKMGMLPA